MSFTDKLIKSLDETNLDEFTLLVNHPALLINEIFEDGLLQYMLFKYPNISIEFYKELLKNPNVDVNRGGENGMPPIISTTRVDLQDLLLSLPMTDVNVDVDKKLNIVAAKKALNSGNVSQFRKIVEMPRTNMKLINAVLKVGDMVLFRKLL